MTVVLPRLDRPSAIELVEAHRHSAAAEISAEMPALPPTVTYSPLGGARIDRAALQELRNEVLALARDHGMPDGHRELSVFEGTAARLIHRRLEMTPHEASHDEVWSYITCCWLLDVALWRFGREANLDRFVGHLNRNTFRRMWWRAEILGPDIDLTGLGEDELVNIMERPTLFSDRRLARSIAAEFLDRVGRDDTPERMRLMREATKRLLRLTPFVAFPALDEDAVRRLVSDAFDAAAAGLAGERAVMPTRAGEAGPPPSPTVTSIPTMTIVAPAEEGAGRERKSSSDFDEVAQVALDIVRRTGRVTNMALREVVPITSDEAREVFASLLERGELVRRGVKRGTHYVLPEEQPHSSNGDGSPVAPQPETPLPRPARGPAPRAPTETALRRLIRRVR